MPSAQQRTGALRRAVDSATAADADSTRAWIERARVALRYAFGDESDFLARFDALRFQPGMAWSGMSSQVWDRARERGVRDGLAILNAAIEQLELEGDEPTGPAFDAGGLHPWIAAQSAALWDGGHKRQAVEEAARAVEVQLKAKVGVTDGTGTRVVSAAFSTDPPSVDNPRLRFTGFAEGTEDWRNAHQGAGSFGRGVMMRVRNLYVHGHDPSDEEALEALAAVSLLARWVEEAQVVPAPPT